MIFIIRYSVIITMCYLLFYTPALLALQIDSVYPILGVTGQELEIDVKGSGFGSDMRVFAYMNYDHGFIEISNGVQNIKVQDNFAYAASGDKFLIINVGDLKNPVVVKQITIPAKIIEIEISGSMAYAIYAAESLSGLQIIDINDPYNAKVLNTITWQGKYARCFEVNGENVFVAYSSKYQEDVWGADYEGNYTFGDYGIKIIDVNEPINPIEVKDMLINKGYVNDIKVHNSIIYMASGTYGMDSIMPAPSCLSERGLEIINVSDLGYPSLLKSLSPGYVSALTVNDGNINFLRQPVPLYHPWTVDYCYDYSNLNDMHIYDNNNPLEPVSKSSLKLLPDFTYTFEDRLAPSEIMIFDDIAYIINPFFNIIDITQPEYPISISNGGYSYYNEFKDIYVYQNRIYACNENGIMISSFNRINSLQIKSETEFSLILPAFQETGKISIIVAKDGETFTMQEAIIYDDEKNDLWPSSSSFDFGVTQTGNITDPQSVTITNVSNENITVNSISVTEQLSGYSISNDNCSNATLSPSEECTFDISFLPNKEGKIVSDIRISYQKNGGAELDVILQVSGWSYGRTYKFERMWPTIQQPWYFGELNNISTDADGYIYLDHSVKSWSQKKIQKFTSDGKYVGIWGEMDTLDFDFGTNGSAYALIDSDPTNYYDYIGENEEIGLKLTMEGEQVLQWGALCGMQENPIASYWVYQCIEPSTTNLFLGPVQIEVDKEGNIYVTDQDHYLCMQPVDRNMLLKFNTDGEFLAKWEQSTGSVQEKFNKPTGIAIDQNGFVYLADTGNNRILKLTSDGEYVLQWGGSGSNSGQFNTPTSIEIDKNDFVYVADSMNYRIQKFDSNGTFLSEWGKNGVSQGDFQSITDMTTDDNGNIYVVDNELKRIQKFSSDGLLLMSWQSSGNRDGEFNNPSGITMDGNGYVYIADSGNHRVQKFSFDGRYLGNWGSFGSANGQFDTPKYIDTDEQGFIYVKDNDNIQKLTAEGAFISEVGDRTFSFGNTADSLGFTYSANGSTISVHTSDGHYVGNIGIEGRNPGEFGEINDIIMGTDNKLYVTDKINNRVQVLRPVPHSAGISKAVIVAGGGPYLDNSLWDTTRACANFAYRTLTYQGFTKETIYYLTSDTELDLDENDVLDDVDGDSTNENLEHAIKVWGKDADELVIYITNHGGDSTFRMSETETLSASDLDKWLDDVQDTIPGRIIVIYDACESGSFISQLTPPGGKQRIVISSTSPDEPANFLTQGTISFSNFFWSHIFNGSDIYNAFTMAKGAMESPDEYQHPQLDANGNGNANEQEDMDTVKNTYIGYGTKIYDDIPLINEVSEDQTIFNTNQAMLSASGVTDNDGIARVWAVIRPPECLQWSSDNPIQEYLTIDLKPAEDDQWKASYKGFNIKGTYRITIYAMDRSGMTSHSKLTTVSVENPLRRRAIVVTGGSEFDPGFELFLPVIENTGKLVYEALSFQGYSKDDMYFLSPVTIADGTNGLPTLSNMEYAITQWSVENTQDVVIYLLGDGDTGTFIMNKSEILTVEKLDQWLDTLQNDTSILVTIIYDAPRSGSFLETLKPEGEQKRILLSSTGSDQAAYFLSHGHISFSQFFWRRILNGSKILDAFLNAQKAMTASCYVQTPMIDDNGNGIGNEKSDGIIARNVPIGTGIILASDSPIIGNISEPQNIENRRDASIWADNITTTEGINEVWAVITPPCETLNIFKTSITTLPIIYLDDNNNGKYSGTYYDFFNKGTYSIDVYAKDSNGNISMSKNTIVTQNTNLNPELGNINGDEVVDLTDAIIALKVLAGMDTGNAVRSDYTTAIVDVDGNNRVGMQELIYILQDTAQIR
ncbi:Peptidase C13 domain-containing protein, NHL repeat-containing [Desulfonema limicola]|uniref:Peptidase C13 domain-containing protein, NHL repeat-containing n=1 Tax=Desulfonema limicola TaxID=45656 RepID=A0A975B4U4_9BACT|nr:C13 family peptidase [Desulfonema limicola]QTA78799.1 Peptidase C13 domain-containing protein, NHL repeat-containing [Desulfonema limicola]